MTPQARFQSRCGCILLPLENPEQGSVQQVETGRYGNDSGQLTAGIGMVKQLEVLEDVLRDEKKHAQPDKKIWAAPARQADRKNKEGKRLGKDRVENRL